VLLSAMDHLVGLTTLRDRDQLDLSLTQALADLLDAQVVGVHRVIKDKHEVSRWLRAAVLRAGQAPVSDPSWVETQQLPALDDFPLRVDALADQLVVQVALPPAQGEGWLTVLPLSRDRFQPGVVEVQTTEPLSMDQVRSLQSLLMVVHNYQRLLDSSQRDPLTGLLNRQTFDTTFLAASLPPQRSLPTEVCERRDSVGDTWWLGMIDIDHFKLVNDRFGHLIGDEVLVLVARLMQQTFRQYDRLFRFGGEEFVVMVRCPLESGAMIAFERLRRTMEEYPFPQVGCVTVSVGVTQVLKADAPSSAFSRADEAVYQAKREGRNRVLSQAALVAQGLVVATTHEGDVELF
jgi:diguanylate cyclase (GGDEF)-like protein